MVLALDGDSTMTSLVPRPSPVTAAPLLALAPPALAGVLVALAVVAAFVFVVVCPCWHALPVLASAS